MTGKMIQSALWQLSKNKNQTPKSKIKFHLGNKRKCFFVCLSNDFCFNSVTFTFLSLGLLITTHLINRGWVDRFVCERVDGLRDVEVGLAVLVNREKLSGSVTKQFVEANLMWYTWKYSLTRLYRTARNQPFLLVITGVL